jgi:N-hydroxyarylamine O-acetyltransferase
MDVKAYLDRINYSGSVEPTLDTLRALHLAHLYAVPFENLDIHLGNAIVLDYEKLYDKIVNQRRGGFCYELNGMFGWLLTQLGFKVSMLNARVFGGDGKPGIEFDHMTLRVDLDEPWLADVGFGEAFREPLRMNEREPQVQAMGTYCLDQQGELWTYYEQGEDGALHPAYIFSLTPHALTDFESGRLHNTTSPDSHFTQKRVCTLATPDGRITLRDNRLILTNKGQRTEYPVFGENDYTRALHEYFGIVVDPTPQFC